MKCSSKMGIYLGIATSVFIMAGVKLHSTEWVRSRVMEYYLDQKNFEIAEEIGMKIMRKRFVMGTRGENSMRAAAIRWDHALAPLIEKEVSTARNEWNRSRSFFLIRQSLLDQSVSRFKMVQSLLEPRLIEDLSSWKRCNQLISSLMPYSAETGYLENDVHPESGTMSFNCTGGVALDANLRSIGANLGARKSVAAVRLQRWADETRIRPENLSLWISDDNKIFHRYNKRMTFSNEHRALLVDHLALSCQFLKIHCDFRDDQYTFAEDFKRILEVYGPPDLS